MTTPVVYRVFKDGGDVIALFPTIQGDVSGRYCESYQHVGQHGNADYTGCVAASRRASLDEHADLHNELIQIGYDDLKVYKRKPPR